MPHADGLKKCLTESKEAVIYVIDATELVQESMERIKSFPPATVHLGQGLMAAALLQALSDGEDEKVSLQWNTPGPFGSLYVEARNFGEVRGTIMNPQAAVFDFATKLGDGTLQVRRSRYGTTTSVVNCEGDASLDILNYLEQSEQRNCGINLSVKIHWKDEKQEEFEVAHALGYLIDILPQNSVEALENALVRWNRQMLKLGDISKWLLRPEHALEDMLQLISGEPAPKTTFQQRVTFRCRCSEERAARALALANRQEGFTPQGASELRCEYCGKIYVIPPSA